MTAMVDRRTLLAGMLVGLAAPAIARSARAALPAAAALMGGWVAERRLAGATLVVGDAAGRERRVMVGNRGLRLGGPVDRDTIFRQYSMTKPVTGVMAMMLIEDGKLRLDQDIAEFVPAFANPRVLRDPKAGLASRPARGPITVRHLLTHTSGLIYHFSADTGPLAGEYRRAGLMPGLKGMDVKPGDGRIPTSLDDFATKLAAIPLLFEPGTRWNYSVGLDLLGLVLERASGMALGDLFERRLFGPLGMADTGFRHAPVNNRRLAYLYAETKRGLLPVDGPPLSRWGLKTWPTGGAGLVSTTRDYARFARMLLNEGELDGRRVMPRLTARAAMSNLLPAGARFGPG